MAHKRLQEDEDVPVFHLSRDVPTVMAADNDNDNDSDSSDDQHHSDHNIKTTSHKLQQNEAKAHCADAEALHFNQKLPLTPPLLRLDVTNPDSIRRFLLQPLPRGLTVQCEIHRKKTGFLGKYPTYEARMAPTMGDYASLFLMYAKRQSGNTTSNYHITMDRLNIDSNSKCFLGKVRSNFAGTEYVVYDDGVSPRKAGTSHRNARMEIGGIIYDTKIVPTHPRGMVVTLPSAPVAAHSAGVIGIMNRYRNNDFDGTFLLKQKQPQWSPKTQSYNLNFYGRVKKPSVKNFILEYEGDNGVDKRQTDARQRTALLFGKLSDDGTFIMDVQWPLSPMQAFAICLSSFDPKLSCD